MKYKAHPTTYAGVNFRSRLEARWAALFDLVSLEWHYEPCDLDGWVPDFALTDWIEIDGKKHAQQYLVEVKPLDWLKPIEPMPELQKAFNWLRTKDKEDHRDLLIFGQHPLYLEYLKALYFPDAVRPVWCARALRHPDSPNGIICGPWFFASDDDALRYGWAKAGNKTQWRAPTRTR